MLDRRLVRAMGSAPGGSALAWNAAAIPGVSRGPTWTGNVRRLGSFSDRRLDNARDVWIYLPRSYYTSEHRYPVLYFNDGQNVFDAATSFAGVEWQADETLESAAGGGVIHEAIAVAVANSARRIDEYTPATDPRWPGGGRAELYVDFLVRELKPRIDAEFRTLADREHTAIIGSSLGGLLSLYAGVAAAETFGLVGALSPVLDWAGYDIEWRYAAAAAPRLPHRIWVDMGTGEDHGEPRHIGDLRRFCSVLERRGYERGRTYECEETPLARHDERAWAERLPRVLRFLIPARC